MFYNNKGIMTFCSAQELTTRLVVSSLVSTLWEGFCIF